MITASQVAKSRAFGGESPTQQKTANGTQRKRTGKDVVR